MKKISLFLFLILTVSCSSDNNSEDNNNLPTNYTIGSVGPGGGRIFYLDETNQHGLEVSGSLGLYKFGYVGMTYPANVTAVPGLSLDFGKGAENTIKIINYMGDNNGEPYAAKVCADFVQSNKDDWYLPSKAELYKIYRAALDNSWMDWWSVGELMISSSQYSPNAIPGSGSCSPTCVYGIEWVTSGWNHEQWVGSAYPPYTVRAIRNF